MQRPCAHAALMCSCSAPCNAHAALHALAHAEWNIIYDKLAKCAASGAKVVLSRLAIGDLATQYFADRDIFCAGRVGTFNSRFNTVGG